MQYSAINKPRYTRKNQLVQTIFKDASLGIIVVNKEGIIQLANPFTLRLFGYSGNELTGKKIELLIPERFGKKYILHWREYLSHPDNRARGHFKNDLYGVKKNGDEFPIEVSLGHYKDQGELYVIAYFNDITLRKKEEAEIKQLNETLEEKVTERTHELIDTLKKLEATRSELLGSLEKERGLNELKSRFVTIASHEFRTPLSTILSSTFLLERYCNTEDQPRRKKHIDRIISSVNLLTDILNDFLSVGKIEEGKIAVKITDFDISHHISNTIGEMKSLLKQGQQILYKHTGAKSIKLDAGILKHIAMNLLSNAIKFSPEETIISVNTVRKDTSLVLSVKDQGIGIPQEEQEYLFNRFYRGSNVTNVQGTGLGLHIVAKYAELLNGKISCASKLGKGSAFSIQFDRKKEEKNSAGFKKPEI